MAKAATKTEQPAKKTSFSKEEKRQIAMKVMDAQNKTQGRIAVGFAKDVAKPLRFLPTPSEDINAMIGGGFPIGRITEIFGNNSSGKTSICAETIGEDMQADKNSFWAWLESEESFDPDYMQNVHDVDLNRLIYIDVAEEGAEASLDRLESLIRTGILKGFVINSVAGLTPKKEMDDDLEKANIALQARMMSKLMRKWTGLIGRKDIVALYINQLRTDVNSRFGDPNVTTGGRALAFYSSLRFGMNNLKLQDADPITAEDGLKLNARVAKNRCVYDNPYKKCEFYVLYGVGVDKITEIIDKAPEANILRKAGAWFYYEKEDGELITAPKAIVDGVEKTDVPLSFQGRTKLRTFLGENEWFLTQLKDELRGKAKRGDYTAATQSDEEMKEIEKLSQIEKEIEREMADIDKPAPAKAKAKAKAPAKRKPASKKKEA